MVEQEDIRRETHMPQFYPYHCQNLHLINDYYGFSISGEVSIEKQSLFRIINITAENNVKVMVFTPSTGTVFSCC